MAAGWILGVDFGTSNTAAAHTSVRTGDIETLPLSHRGNLMPSNVLVRSGEILVGDVATANAYTDPAAYVPAPKLFAGQPSIRVGVGDVPVVELIAAVLKAVVDRAVGVHNGNRPDLLVLTHPVAWAPAAIDTLVDAAIHIGFGRHQIRTVSEPVAAAQFYTRTTTLTPGERIAVFDFGGGTLDVAVLATGGGHTFDVIASRGDNRLGGRNLDAKIRQWVDTELRDEDPDLREHLRSPAGARSRIALDESVLRAKELLTDAPTATVTVDTASGHQHSLQLSRDQLDHIIGPEIDRGILLARTVLHDARIGGPDDLAAFYLTGGSSRIPLVRHRLQQLGRVATLDDPKTVVARGALYAVTAAAPTTSAVPPAQLVGSAPTAQPTAALDAAAKSSRTKWIAAAGVGVLAAGGVAIALTSGGNDSADAAPEATGAPQTSQEATATPESAPRDQAADEKAIRDLTTEFLAKAGSGSAAELNPMRCADQQAPTDSPKPTTTLTYSVGDFISTSVTGDTASARFNLQEKDEAGTRTGIMVGDYAYENGSWKWCGSSVQ